VSMSGRARCSTMVGLAPSSSLCRGERRALCGARSCPVHTASLALVRAALLMRTQTVTLALGGSTMVSISGKARVELVRPLEPAGRERLGELDGGGMAALVALSAALDHGGGLVINH